MKRILTAILACILIVGITGTTVFAQDYIYTSEGGAPVKKVEPGWNSINYNGRKMWYYGDSNGNFTKGWKKINGKWYAFMDTSNAYPGRTAGWAAYDTGRMFAGGTYAIKESGGTFIYSFKDSGEMAKGWVHGSRPAVENAGTARCWYYHDPVTGRAVTGWKKIDGKWYYFTKGEYVNWPEHPNMGVKVFTGCTMKTGWLNLNDTWYYLSSSGAMVTGWQKINGTWYYFKSDGSMAAGEWYDGYWLSKSGAWTYKPRGSWVKDAKGWRFVDTSGWYAKNETVKINGKSYKFNINGYWMQLLY